MADVPPSPPAAVPAAVPDSAPVEAPPAAPPAPPAPACRTCDAPLSGPICSRCGEREMVGRLTVGRIVQDALSSLFNLDRGLLHTLLTELRRPGQAARDFVSGRTVPYSRPFAFLVIGITVAQLVSLQFGIVDELVRGFFEGSAAAGAELQTATSGARAFLAQWFVVLMAATIPILALVSRVLFLGTGHNYAEHLVSHCYALGATSMAYAALTPLAHLSIPATQRGVEVLLHLSLVAQYVRSTRGFAARSWWGAVLAVVLYGFVGMLLVGFVLTQIV